MLKHSLSRYHKEIPKSLFTTLRVVGAVFIGHSLLPIRCESNSNSKKCEKHLLTAAILGSIPAVIFYPLIVRGLGRENMGVSCYYFIVNRIFWYTLFNMLKGALMLPTTLVEMALFLICRDGGIIDNLNPSMLHHLSPEQLHRVCALGIPQWLRKR